MLLLVFFSGVISSWLLCSVLVLLIEVMVMLMVWFGLVNGGRLVVMIIVVVFFSCGCVLVGIMMLNCCSMFFRFCVVNGVCVVWLFELFRLIIRL